MTTSAIIFLMADCHIFWWTMKVYYFIIFKIGIDLTGEERYCGRDLELLHRYTCYCLFVIGINQIVHAMYSYACHGRGMGEINETCHGRKENFELLMSAINMYMHVMHSSRAKKAETTEPY